MNWDIEFADHSWLAAVGVVTSVLVLSLLGVAVSMVFRRSPAARHTFLFSALITCLVCPLIGVLVTAAGQPVVELELRRAAADAAHVISAPGSVDLTAPGQMKVSRGATSQVSPLNSSLAAENPSEVSAAVVERSSLTVVPGEIGSQAGQTELDWRVLICGLWVCGSLFYFAMMIRGLLGVGKVIRNASKITTASVLSISREAAEEVGLANPPQLLESAAVRAPAVVGCRKMSVVFPPEVFAVTAADELRSILIHEFAHVRRWDPTVVLLQSIARCLFWPILSIHWLDRELSRAREEVCDNYVLRQTTTVAYGQTLLKLGQLAIGTRPLYPSVGMLNWRGKLEDRIAGFLKSDRSRATATSRTGTLAMILVSVALATMICGTRFVQADQEPPAESEKSAESEKNDTASETESIDPKLSENFLAKIVDADGAPVADAKVELWQLAYGGGSRSPQKAYQHPRVTDAQGRATVPYPIFADDDGKLATRKLGLKVTHEKFPVWASYLPVEHNVPIRLPRAVWATIAANLPGGIPVASDLVAETSGQQPRSTMLGPTLRVGPLDLTSARPANLLRVIHAPKDGPVFFSELVDLRTLDREENEISLSLQLHPASTVTGKLSDDVPRPATNGVVIAKTINGPAAGSPWIWSERADIAADGSFTLKSIPHDEHLQLIAICDGWISLPPRPSEVEEYSKLFNYDILHNDGAGTGRVTPQLHYVSEGTSETTIAMHPAGTVTVTVVDWDNRPVAGAMVTFNPNQAFYNLGSQSLGDGVGSVERLRLLKQPEKERATILKDLRNSRRRYHAITNEQGKATVSNLPAHLSWYRIDDKDQPSGQFIGFSVTHEGYRLVPAEPQRIISAGRVRETVDMKPGETTSIRVRMERIGEQRGPAKAVTKEAGTRKTPQPSTMTKKAKADNNQSETIAITVTGTAKDHRGNRVAGAKVRLLSTGEKEGLLAETTTDADGQYKFQKVQLPVRRSEKFIDGGAINVFATADSYGICWHGQRSVLLVPRPKNDPPSAQDTRFYEGESIVMDLEFLPAARLYGRVLNEVAEAVEGATIRLSSLDFLDSEGKVYSHNDREFWGMKLPESYRVAKSDDQGNFEIRGLPKETVGRVRISHDKHASQSLYVAITDRDIDQYTFSANNMTSIANGKVVRYPKMETRKVATCPLKVEVAQTRLAMIDVVNRRGDPVAGVFVSASSGGRATGTSASGKSGKDGSVKLQLPPGDYRLVGRPARDSSYVFSYDNLKIPVTDQPVRQKLRLTSGCTLILKVIDADSGAPVAGVGFWRDVKDQRNARTSLNSTVTYVDHPVTDEQGIMRAVVEPGTRQIGVGFGVVPKPYRSGGAGGRRVECKEGGTESLTFELRKVR